MVFKRNYFPKNDGLFKVRRPAGSHAHRKSCRPSVNKWRETDTLLLHTTDRKHGCMAYLFVPFPMTLDDLEGHSPNAGLIKCNSTNICATFSTVLTDTSRRAVPRR